jgi:hypothetical protein
MSGIMQMAANLTQQVTTDTSGFAIPVIFSVTNGIVVTSKICKAVVILHGLYIDESGIVKVGSTSRIMVSEPALKTVGFPTRDTNNKLILKDCGVTFTDIITGIQATFVIREAIGNSMTGLTSCTLGNAGTITPPGRTIIGWQPASIIVNVTATPSPNTQTLANGDIILTDYSLNINRTLTVPYMVGYAALSSFFLNGREIQDVQYTAANGTFNNGLHGGFNNGNQIKFDGSIPIWQS